jgi:hypothetical protein
MFVATCAADGVGGEPCDWSEPAPVESEAKVLTALHVLHRHPEEYRKFTGKDPDAKKFEYREYANAYKGRY